MSKREIWMDIYDRHARKAANNPFLAASFLVGIIDSIVDEKDPFQISNEERIRRIRYLLTAYHDAIKEKIAQ